MAVTTWLIGALFIGLGLTNVWFPLRVFDMDGPLRLWLFVPLTVGTAAMVVKRRYPIPVLAIGTACFIFDTVASGGSLGMLLVLFDLLFTVGMVATPRVRKTVTGLFIVGAVALAAVVAISLQELRMLFFVILQFGALVLVPLWWSGNLRQQQQLAVLADSRAEAERGRAELAREHAEDQSRLADLSAQQAIRQERAAMARDIHDVIASHLSSVAIHSGAALSRPADSEADRRALQVVREESLASLTEMRAMITLLRSPDGTVDSDDVPGGLERLDRLLDGFRARGSRLEAAVDDVTDLPTEVDRAAYRIIHEALTNASKHAHGCPVRLVLTRTGTDLELTVGNPLGEVEPAMGNDPWVESPLHSGVGLISMRERAEGLGGAFRAGPDDTGGWRVRVTLPITRPGGPEDSLPMINTGMINTGMIN
ncbi:MAG: sensor histidine kinase, partial [Propionibacteriaceae bacterium]